MPQLSRRNFVKLGTAAGGVAAAGTLGYGFAKQAAFSEPLVEAREAGHWQTVGCWNNCSCTASRCLLQTQVVDGVPVRMRSDFSDPDTEASPQLRACPRGRAQVKNVLAPTRLKYPMVRKNWAPGGGDKSLRGRDEWRRISWEEALDITAKEMQRIYDEHGPKSIYYAAWGYENNTFLWDPMGRVFYRMGGAVRHFGTVSWGSWPWVEMKMLGTLTECNDATTMGESDLIVLFGANWAVNKGGNNGHILQMAKERGAKIVVIDPWLNRTTAGIADQWIPIRPGTDGAMVLGVAYHMIQNNLHDQAFLDKYCVGFDADHMPEGADPQENFKDYVLGTYDGVPKTPEWASTRCGVHVDVIRAFADELGRTDLISYYGGMSTSKIPAGETWCQIFYTLAMMTGSFGKAGATATWRGPNPDNPKNVIAGGYGDEIPVNPLAGPDKVVGAPNVLSDKDWLELDWSETWQSILDGEVGRDSWNGGKKPVDIRMIYHGQGNFLNSQPNTAAGIKVHREKAEFVVASNISYTTTAQYADIVFPISTLWERPYGQVYGDMRDSVLYWQQAMEPIFETRSDMDVALGIAERLGFDPDEVMSNSWKQKEFNTLAGSQVMKPDGSEMEPLVTITQADIDEWGVEGEPQQGRITIEEFAEAGVYKVPREIGDDLTFIHLKDFIEDPEANPAATASGKLEIHCQGLADHVNVIGYSHIDPIGKYQEEETGHGWHQTNDEYPLVMFSPHSLRRAHTNFDNVPWLRQAFQQECFISSVDAAERGIKTDDTVLMESPYGKVLRRAKVLEHLVPGAVALEDGGWLNMNEDGMDTGGCPNVLQAPAASGSGVQAWTGTLIQVTKWDGEPLKADHLRDIKTPIIEGV